MAHDLFVSALALLVIASPTSIPSFKPVNAQALQTTAPAQTHYNSRSTMQAELAHLFGDAATAIPFDRELSNWQGRIAVAAKNGGGLDVCQAALNWAKQEVMPENGLREKAKQEIRDAAERHLADGHGLGVIEAIYGAIFPEEVGDLANHYELDGCASEINDNAEIKRLAELDRMEYDRARKGAAKQLGVTVGALDREVNEHRKQHKEESTPSVWSHWDVESWPESVDSQRLLRALIERIQKHVVLTADQAVVVALWVMFTWVHEKAAVHSPILLVTSPEPNCGKSTLLGVVSYLVRRSLVSVSIKGPPLFRSIEKWQPTFVIDEADTALANNDDLKEVVNSGWTRGQSVMRCDPETYDPCPFSTFAPKAIGMKGRNLLDTTLSRAVIVEMQRKLPGERVTDFDHIDDAGLKELRRKLSRWAEENGEQLASHTPTIPDGFHNRVRANWKLLLAIAELAGADLKARQAAMAVENIQATFEASLGIELLHDILGFFEAAPERDAVFTKELIDWLVAAPERPWAAYGRVRKPITDRQIAKLLGAYRIVSGTVRFGAATNKGYQRKHFAEAWKRYPKPKSEPEGAVGDLPPPGVSEHWEIPFFQPNPDFQPSQRRNTDETGISGDFASVTEIVCDAHEKSDLSSNDGRCDAVTLLRRGISKGPGNGVPERRCGYCGRTGGDLQETHYGEASTMLHRDCQDAWRAAYDLDIRNQPFYRPLGQHSGCT
jgi:hypothetical protein